MPNKNGKPNTSQTLSTEELESGHLILHTIKVWVSHEPGEILKTGTDQEAILDLVSRGEVVRHRLDGASVWARDDNNIPVCIDEDPPEKHLESLTDEQHYFRDQILGEEDELTGMRVNLGAEQ